MAETPPKPMAIYVMRIECDDCGAHRALFEGPSGDHLCGSCL